jgi:hypothetical protein
MMSPPSSQAVVTLRFLAALGVGAEYAIVNADRRVHAGPPARSRERGGDEFLSRRGGAREHKGLVPILLEGGHRMTQGHALGNIAVSGRLDQQIGDRLRPRAPLGVVSADNGSRGHGRR